MARTLTPERQKLKAEALSLYNEALWEVTISMKCKATQLGTRPGYNGSNHHWLVAIYDHNGKPSQVELEKAKAEYRRKYPGSWHQSDDIFNVIWVVSQRNKLRIERILRDRPARTAFE